MPRKYGYIMNSGGNKAEKHKLPLAQSNQMAKRPKLSHPETAAADQKREKAKNTEETKGGEKEKMKFGELFDAKGGFKLLGDGDVSFEHLAETLRRSKQKNSPMLDCDTLIKTDNQTSEDYQDEQIKAQLDAVQSTHVSKKTPLLSPSLTLVPVYPPSSSSRMCNHCRSIGR